MRKFDTKVQLLKYKVIREVAIHEFAGDLLEKVMDIPQSVIAGKEAKMRCCVYKERAIVGERVKLAMGGNKENENVVEVIDIACDECPVGGYEITNACRGCIAHHCEDVCPRNAITYDANQKANIDKSKCIECGLCSKVCPYTAIINRKRPCENACKVNAISMSESHTAAIDNEKCISCGACVYQCPFGAIVEKSYIIEAIKLIKESQNNKNYKLYAVVAPSISSQFTYAKLGQVIAGIKELGFHTVVEAALGADMVAIEETKELIEKGMLTSSCCPAFVQYIKNDFPDLNQYISHNLSPMALISKYIKNVDPTAKVIFIGPCVAKKKEMQKSEVKEYVDCVLTFEELQALFDSKNIDIVNLNEELLDNASYYGRIFARSGGLKDAVVEGMKELGETEFELRAVSCDGIEECKKALFKLQKNVLNENFIEGMACVGGCIGGAGCLTHGVKDKNEVDKYGKEAYEKTIFDAISVLR